jgi:H/ACA ribonucleoprotein complex subunit 2
MDEEDYNRRLKYVTPIAFPIASLKLCPKVLKLCKKATKAKQVKRGVKEVVKAIRKKNKGSVFFLNPICAV